MTHLAVLMAICILSFALGVVLVYMAAGVVLFLSAVIADAVHYTIGGG